MARTRLYASNAEKQRAYRERRDSPFIAWARRRMTEAGYDVRAWTLRCQWKSGKTLWTTDLEDGRCVIADPDTGTIRKLRRG